MKGSNRTVAQALQETIPALRQAAEEEAAQQARLLLAHVLGFAPGAIPAHAERMLTAEEETLLAELIVRRRAREPLQYLLGEWAFMGLPMRVRAGVLIPRQDTETLAEAALALAAQQGYATALDVCCGTGCIGIALARLGGLSITFADISAECLALAQENAALNGVTAAYVQGSYFAPVTGVYDMILCNPPYLTGADMEALQPEVAYEPALALYGGADGLDAYRAIQAGYEQHIAPDGALLLEVGAGQAEDVCAIFGGGTIYTDINGIARVICVRAAR